jgi:phosphate transport system ATP-binding protein
LNREPSWKIKDLNVRFGAKVVLCKVSLDIADRAVTAVIGPSGCGKSTFLLCLNQLSAAISGCRVEGSILFQSQNILSPSCDDVQLRRRIGLIFQRPNPFPMSIRRNLELPLREHGLRDRTKIAEAVENALTAVGLWTEVKDRLNAPAQLLSGGQQQRLCIARALVLGPEALLMDEPCSALDPIAASVIEELICSLRERLTIVIVTHNLRQAERVGDDVALFWSTNGEGGLIESGSVGEVFRSPKHELAKLYLSGRIG